MRPARSALGSGCAKGAKSTRDTVPSAAIQSLSSSEGAGRSFAEAHRVERGAQAQRALVRASQPAGNRGRRLHALPFR